MPELTKEDAPIIANLSTIIDYDLEETIQEFVKLSKTYSPSCFCGCPGFFQELNHSSWVKYQIFMNETLIQNYRLGKLTTMEFICELAYIFSFLKEIEEENFPICDPNDYLCTLPYHRLLEKAWNASIHISEHKKNRFIDLVIESKPVYLVANTNELNIFKILKLLKSAHPNFVFSERIDEDILTTNENKRVLLGEQNGCPVYFYLSYHCQKFKTTGLIEDLISTFDAAGIKRDNITVVSQHPADLETAEKYDIINRYRDDEYFRTGLMTNIMQAK